MEYFLTDDRDLINHLYNKKIYSVFWHLDSGRYYKYLCSSVWKNLNNFDRNREGFNLNTFWGRFSTIMLVNRLNRINTIVCPPKVWSPSPHRWRLTFIERTCEMWNGLPIEGFPLRAMTWGKMSKPYMLAMHRQRLWCWKYPERRGPPSIKWRAEARFVINIFLFFFIQSAVCLRRL